MTVIQFPNHNHPSSAETKCLHCAILDLVDREFSDIGTQELAQKLVEVLADVIRYGADDGFHEDALRDVQQDLAHVLQQKMVPAGHA
jgi:uncharacterized protein YheU (UPF0270 family)